MLRIFSQGERVKAWGSSVSCLLGLIGKSHHWKFMSVYVAGADIQKAPVGFVAELTIELHMPRLVYYNDTGVLKQINEYEPLRIKRRRLGPLAA